MFLDADLELPKVGAVLKGRYVVRRRLNLGGMGVVYEAIDRNVEARRAVKVMLPSLVTGTMRERFRQEASIPGKIESENVVDVLDHDVDDLTGLPFLVMELLVGEDLESRLRKGRLSSDETLRHVHRVGLALDRAHAADIVHRDIKPENLFVTRHDDGTEGLKVLDFGIAKLIAESSRPRTTSNLGTPLYMSPEQIRGEGTIGPSSDIYSLGHVVFTLLVGQAYWQPEFERLAANPFLTQVAAGATEQATLRAARLGASLAPAFDRWFARATAASPGQRFDSASELVLELAGALSLPPPQRAPHSSIAYLPTLLSNSDATRRNERLEGERSSSTDATGGMSSGTREHQLTSVIQWGLIGAGCAAVLLGAKLGSSDLWKYEANEAAAPRPRNVELVVHSPTSAAPSASTAKPPATPVRTPSVTPKPPAPNAKSRTRNAPALSTSKLSSSAVAPPPYDPLEHR